MDKKLKIKLRTDVKHIYYLIPVNRLSHNKKKNERAGLLPTELLHVWKGRRYVMGNQAMWYMRSCLRFSQGYLFVYVPFLYLRLDSSRRRQY